MGFTWSTEQKVCASCKYWLGRRKNTGGPFYETEEDEGQCNGPAGSFNPTVMNHGASCTCWEPAERGW